MRKTSSLQGGQKQQGWGEGGCLCLVRGRERGMGEKWTEGVGGAVRLQDKVSRSEKRWERGTLSRLCMDLQAACRSLAFLLMTMETFKGTCLIAQVSTPKCPIFL